MQTQNNYDKEVFNGDIGRIAAIDDDEQRADASTSTAARSSTTSANSTS